MIVKNESKIITRLFDSVISIIDTYCICDTGSTDNTIEIIKNYFNEKNINGKVITEPFINFAYNRNFALNGCLGMSDYILLLDADMILEINNFDKNILNKANIFYILQGNNSFYYQNTRILKNDGLSKYVGMTHEYIKSPHIHLQIPKNNLFINDIGDGGAKTNKFERDILLLKQGIIDEPNNHRYYFYLANSYYDSKQYNNAIETYLIRIKLDGWKEEVWYSYYRLGLIYKQLNDIAKAIYYWLEGYNYYPNRLEGLYEILKYYRENSKYNLIKYLYPIIKNELDKKENRDNYLFLHNDVYTYKIYYEYSIFAYYLGIKNINDEIVLLLNSDIPNNDMQSSLQSSNIQRNNIYSNMKYYKDILVPMKVIDFTNKKSMKEYNSSSSCLIKNKNNNGYKLNVRYVNYTIDNLGKYKFINNTDTYSITINEYRELDNSFNIINSNLETSLEEKSLEENTSREFFFKGIEDVRIFYDTNNNLKFIGTGFVDSITVLYGDYLLDKNKVTLKTEVSTVELKQTFINTKYEKNWVLVNYQSKTRIIYNWFPLTICDIDSLHSNTLQSNLQSKNINIIAKKDMPLIFKNTRGSTCGYEYKSEQWFIVHITEYGKPRNYYHIICVFDTSMNLLRYTAPFKFEGEPIEYCLSIIIEDNKVIINYSTWDRTTKIAIYNKDYIENKLKYN
jgi:glycosyltransferase involved in cell wall biosynthesis